jgi:hypothetical protein
VPQPPRFQREPPPPGIVYNTAMATPDAALALGALWAYERARRARVAGVCVTGGGFKAAVFCDVVNQFYRPGARHGNDALAVGLADVAALPADAPMVSVPVDRRGADGAPLYARTIERVSDTSLAEAQLRNAITFNAETTMVLSAPARSLARSLEIAANRDLYAGVRRLVLVESPRLYADTPALERLLRGWPTEIVLLGAELAASVVMPSGELDAAFEWSKNHPVVDFYHAYRAVPYDVPGLDLLAMVFAVDPESSSFAVSVPGRLSLEGESFNFAESAGGSARRLLLTSAPRAGPR